MELVSIQSTDSIAEILAPVHEDLAAVEAKMREQTINAHQALTYATDHLLASGGKRLRPAVALLSAGVFDAPRERAIAIAAAIEMLHTATLVHDDLIDGSLLRRGIPTLNAQWTPAATVLTGDFLFARAAELASQADSVRVMSAFARTLMVIVNGEINQMFSGQGQASRELYFKRIYGKTASLFATATETPAMLGRADEAAIAAMRTFGQEVGMAFQIVDDILDFTADASRLGKPVGSDLRQGLLTLPVLCYMELNPQDRNVMALLDGRSGDTALVDHIVHAVRESGAVEAALEEARAYVARAQSALVAAPDNLYRRALSELAEYFVSRNI
jgi:geranylgeranyl pyrophosphate synthase